MNPEVILRFVNGYLRPLKPEDVHPGYVQGLNDPEINYFLDAVKRTTQTEQSAIDFVSNDLLSANSVLFGIWQEGDESHCGTVRLHGIEHHHQTAHIGVCLFDKRAWGKKIGSKAIMSVTQWAHDYLGLRWVEACAYMENVASRKAFLAGGYEWVCDIPNKYLLDGKPTSVKIYAAYKADC